MRRISFTSLVFVRASIKRIRAFCGLSVSAGTMPSASYSAVGVTRPLPVRLDRTTELNVQLGSSQVSETITVTAEAPVVDPEQVSISQTFDAAYLDQVVTGNNRSYQDVLGQAPGAVDQDGNPAVFGSTDAENAYYIDGVNTTDPVTSTLLPGQLSGLPDWLTTSGQVTL